MKNKLITIALMVIIIVESILLSYFILENKNLNSNQDQNQIIENNTNESEKEAIEWFIFEPLVKFFGENIVLTTLKFTSPEKLFSEELDTSILIYDLLSINNFDEKRKVKLEPEAQQEYGYKFTLEEMQSYLKEKFNLEYSISDLKETFEVYYNDNFKNYISPPWSSTPAQVPPSIKEIYYQDGYYHIEFYHTLNEEKPGKMIIKKEKEKFYLYSSTGLN